MKNLFGLLVIAVITTVSLFSSCSKCRNAEDINYSGAMLEFVDSATGRSLYTETNPLYNKDSLRILDEWGNTVKIKPIIILNDRHWQMELGFYDPQKDPLPFDREVCKNYTIKYNHAESENLRVCFKAKQTDCGSVFEKVTCFQQSRPVGRVAMNVNRFTVTIEKR